MFNLFLIGVVGCILERGLFAYCFFDSNLQIDHIQEKKLLSKSFLDKTRPQAKIWPITLNDVLGLKKANVKIQIFTVVIMQSNACVACHRWAKCTYYNRPTLNLLLLLLLLSFLLQVLLLMAVVINIINIVIDGCCY